MVLNYDTNDNVQQVPIEVDKVSALDMLINMGL